MSAAAVSWVAARAPAAPGPSAWMAFAAVGALLFVFLVGMVWVCVSMVRDWEPREDDSDDGDGGGGQRRDPPSPTAPRGSDPEWWPEFERQFDAYVEGRLTKVG